MKQFRPIQILAFLLASLLLLVSCAQDAPQGSEESSIPLVETSTYTAENTDPPILVPPLTLIEHHATDYVLVIPKIMADPLNNAVSDFRTEFNKRYSISKDESLQQTTDESEGVAKEILIGITDRQESLQAYASLRDNSCTIRVINEKLVILGTDFYRTVDAIDHFMGTYLTGGDSLSVEGTLSVTHTVTGDREARAEQADLRLMSWNVLGWSEKSDIIEKQAATLLYQRPDIVGFQECGSVTHKNVLAQLYKEDYAVVAEYLTGTKTLCCTPILYKRDRFTPVEGGAEWLRGRYTGTGTKSLAWGLFRDKKNGNELVCVINFHGAVASNSYTGMENMTKEELTAQATAWKKSNILQIQQKIESLESVYGDNIKFFVMGDYNSSVGAEPYEMMRTYGYSDAEFSAYETMTGTKSTHTVGKAPVEGKSIDHIFFNPYHGVTAYTQRFITDEDTLDASDHLPLVVDFGSTPSTT